MKMLFNIIIMVVTICASESSVYDWHVKTIESDSDFGDALKVEAALNNERQQDLYKMSGKTNSPEYYSKSSYNPLDRNEANDAAYQNYFQDKYFKRYEENSNFKPHFDKNSNSTRKHDANIYNKTVYSDYNKYNAKQNERFANPQRPLHKENQQESTKNFPHIKHKQHSNNQDDNNNNNKHDAVAHQDVDAKPKLYISDRGDANMKNEIKNKQSANNKYDKNLKENKKLAAGDNWSRIHLDFESFVGTNLFDSTTKKCFSSEDVALLVIRKDFESLIPKNLPQCLFDEQMIALLLNYFYICYRVIVQTSSSNTRHLAEQAFHDTLGGYLNFYMVPVTKYSFYAGQISLNTAQQVLGLSQQSKKFLNTNGNGWKSPIQNVLTELNSVHIEPLHIPPLYENTYNEASFCKQLDMNRDDNQPDNDKMIVQLPKLETENVKRHLGNIWLPLSRKRTFDLKAESSSYIIVKFYEIVTKCYRFETIDQEFYNQQFRDWLVENVHTHLSDEEFYPGLGAVLRIYEYLKGCKKYVIGIGNDLNDMENVDGRYNNYRDHQIRSEQFADIRTTKRNEAKEFQNDIKKTMDSDVKDSNRNSVKTSVKALVDQQTKTFPETDNRLEAALHSLSKNSKAFLRSVDLTATQIAIIAIPSLAFFLIITFCCWQIFFKKKKPQIPITVKNSSSSSSNLFNPPVRFFNIRRKSASNSNAKNYSSNDAGNKKNKKSVQMEKRPLINSDSSVTGSPIRNKKSKASAGTIDKTKTKDSDKSNSKTSWETTFSTK